MTGTKPILQSDLPAALALNNVNAADLAWIEPEDLERLVEQAFFAPRVGSVDAFLIALDQGADYGSPNFQWFRHRYGRFVYIDRIVVAASARGRGLGRLLYRDLFDRASAAGHDMVCCEINSIPPNPTSEAFHAALGFVEVGAAVLAGGKAVRYFARKL